MDGVALFCALFGDLETWQLSALRGNLRKLNCESFVKAYPQTFSPQKFLAIQYSKVPSQLGGGSYMVYVVPKYP